MRDPNAARPRSVERYCRWSRGVTADGGAGVIVGLGLVLFALLPFVVFVLGLHTQWNRIVAGLIVVMGALAAFDAWAAAMYRGARREAWGRAAIVVVMFVGFAVVAMRAC